MSVHVERRGPVTIVTLDRPEVRNAVDTPHAQALHAAFLEFDADPAQSVAILTGGGGTFCAGADLKAVSTASMEVAPPTSAADDIGPMGPSRLRLSKPVIAAVEGYAVAGGLELALWCDLRVADPAATFGVFCRRWGVPLIDGGTIRLPELIGRSRALDLVLTGRAVDAHEALEFGLVNRVSAPGAVLEEAVALAEQIAGFPQACMRSDRESVLTAAGRPEPEALAEEWRLGEAVLLEAVAGAGRFAGGAGRHGAPA